MCDDLQPETLRANLAQPIWPDPWIWDVYSTEIRSTTAAMHLDDLFISACEPDTIQVVSAVSTRAEAVGAWMEGSWIHVRRNGEPIHARITVVVGGIRKGLCD